MRFICWITALILSTFNIDQALCQVVNVNDYNVSFYNTSFTNQNQGFKIWNEAPTVVLNRGNYFNYISTTYFSAAWKSHQSLATPLDDNIIIQQSHQKDLGYITSSSHWWYKFYNPHFLDNKSYKYNVEWQNYHWRRNYNGVFSAHILSLPFQDKKIVYAISHGENKNEKIGNYLYQNTVRPGFKINKRDSHTFSGGKPYTDCWEAYFGFLNGNWSYLETDKSIGEEYFNDIGPIAWPSAGYVNESGQQTSKGLRHPSSIMHQGFLYIYVVDESLDGNNGVKLVRVKSENVLNPTNYETWSDRGWIPSLPTNFNKDNIAEYFAIRGPSNAAVLPKVNNTIRFSVAKFSDSSNEFIGVEEYSDSKQRIHIVLRFSNDLVNWSDEQEVYSAPNWESSSVRYPVFLNSEGTTHNEIDKEEFYVLGSNENGTLTKLWFKKKEQNSFLMPINTTSPTNGFDGSALSKLNESPKLFTDNLQFDEIQIVPTISSSIVNLNFVVKKYARVKVNLYNSNGKLMSNLFEETVKPQTLNRNLNISNLLPGIYYIVISDQKYRAVKKLIKI